MTPASDRKTSPHLWKAIEGFEGTVEFVNSRGIEGIYTFRSLEAAPWLLFASYPTSEAYASLREREQQIIAAAIALTLLSGAFLWWFSRTLLAPLDRFTDAMQFQLRNPEQATEPICVQTEELAKLVSVYSELMEHKRVAAETLRRSELKFRSIINNAGDAFISLDGEGRVTEWNQRAELSFGWTRDEAVGQRLTELVLPPEVAARFLSAFSRSTTTPVRSNLHHQVEVMAMDKAGRRIPVEISVTSEIGNNGFAANAFLRDISGRKQAEELLENSERRLRTVTDNLPMLIGYIDKTQIIQFVNGMSEKWLGLKPESVVNHHLSEVVGGQTYDAVKEKLEKALGGERVKFELEATVRGIKGYNQTIYVPDCSSDGTVAGVYALSTDITSLKTVEKKLERLARYDSLTGLPNRMQLHERLLEAIGRAKRARTAVAVMFLDIDKFKGINDTFGHAFGDEVLQQFAQRLKQSVRGTDTVARLAGDEFVIILEGLNFTDEANLVARKILLAATEEMVISNRNMLVTTSIGIAYCDNGELAPDAFLAQADKALYVAKDAGRNTFHLLLAAVA